MGRCTTMAWRYVSSRECSHLMTTPGASTLSFGFAQNARDGRSVGSNRYSIETATKKYCVAAFTDSNVLADGRSLLAVYGGCYVSHIEYTTYAANAQKYPLTYILTLLCMVADMQWTTAALDCLNAPDTDS